MADINNINRSDINTGTDIGNPHILHADGVRLPNSEDSLGGVVSRLRSVGPTVMNRVSDRSVLLPLGVIGAGALGYFLVRNRFFIDRIRGFLPERFSGLDSNYNETLSGGGGTSVASDRGYVGDDSPRLTGGRNEELDPTGT